MRGLTLLLTVAAGIALLAACDGSSGTAFQTGVATASVDAIQITSPTQEALGTIPLSLQATTAFNKQTPVTLNAEGIHAPGATQVAVVGALFTWTASFATCGGKASSTPAITLDYLDPTNPGVNPDPNHPGYSILLATDQKAAIALFPPIVTPVAPATPSVDFPVGFPIPTAAPLATPTPTPSTATAQYCIVVAAHKGSTTGAATVTAVYP
jgi:hypothetical protein